MKPLVIVVTLMIAGGTAVPAGAAHNVGVIDPRTLKATKTPMPSAASEESRVDPGQAPKPNVGSARDVVRSKATASYCKTTTNRGSQLFAGRTPVFRFALNEYWCHVSWYIGGKPAPLWAASGTGWFANLFFKFDRYEDP